MAGLTTAYAQTLLDYAFPTSAAVDYVAWSENGTSESSALTRTAVGATGWAAATAADPSVKANNTALTSANATAAATIGYFAIFSASTAGTQKTDWTALTASKTLAIGDNLKAAIGALQVTLT